MKKFTKKVLIASLLMVLGFGTKAQKFYVGVQAGPQLSVMFNTDEVSEVTDDYRSKFSYMFGINAGYYFDKRFGAGTEVVYSVDRQRYISDGKERTQQYKYVKVPMLLLFRSNADGPVALTAKLGPQLLVLHKATITSGTSPEMNNDISGRYSDLKLGGMIGLGARVRLAPRWYFDTGLRMDAVFNTQKDDAVSDNSSGYHNFSAAVEAGVKWFL